MTNQTATIKQSDQRTYETVLLTSLVAFLILLTPTTQATPMVVDVYGTPYFALANAQSQEEKEHQWMVLAPAQSFEIDLGVDQINLFGPQDLSVRNPSGQLEAFSLLGMSLSLPGRNVDSYGVIDYLMGDHAGQFNVQEVIHRDPVMNAESALSVFFWGIDYHNGAALVLGLEATPTLNAHTAITPVNEPSLLLLLLMGFGACLLSLVPYQSRGPHRFQPPGERDHDELAR